MRPLATSSCTRAPKGTDEGGGPGVLEDEDACRAVGLQDARRLGDVVVVQQTGREAREQGEVELSVTVEVGDRQGVDDTGGILGDEREVEDADDPAVVQVKQDREAFPGHLVAGELDDDVVDGSDLDLFGHGLVPSLRRVIGGGPHSVATLAPDVVRLRSEPGCALRPTTR